MNNLPIFIQVGATRDGLDPYLACAKKRGMQAWLLETPDYLELRTELKRKNYDKEISLNELENPENIFELLQPFKENIKLMLPGFECYTEATYAAAKKLEVPPCKYKTQAFNPVDKEQQRNILKTVTNQIIQPAYHISSSKQSVSELELELELELSFPVVVKPSNGAGGLGVFLANNTEEVARSIFLINQLTNYNGTKFNKIIIEEYIDGQEMSVQACCHNGVVHILSICEKIITTEFLDENLGIKTFREGGHVGIPGSQLTTQIYDFVQLCAKIFNYLNGPFHIDFIKNSNGIYFLEMGYRLSGGTIVGLVEKVTGLNWADQAFIHILRKTNLSK